MDQKCLLLETSTSHDEIFPSLVYYLNQLGFQVDILTTATNLEKNSLYYTPHLNYRLLPIPAFRRLSPKERQWLSGYDLIVINTVRDIAIYNDAKSSGSLTLKRAIYTGLPWVIQVYRFFKYRFFQRVTLETLLAKTNATVLMTFHCRSMVYRHRYYHSHLRQSPRIKAITLAPHCRSLLPSDIPVTWYRPAYFTEQPFTKTVTTTFVIQGNIVFFRRNYLGLLDVLQKFKSHQPPQFKILLLGNSHTPDAQRLASEIARQGLEAYFEWEHGFLPYRDYYARIGGAHYMLTLIDESFEHDYFTHKISSSISVAVGLQVVPVLHEKLATLYGLESCAISHAENHLYDAMKTALALSPEEYDALKNNLAEVQRKWQEESVDNLRNLLNPLAQK